MKIGVLGTGDVGRTLASGLVKLGHDVRLGSRSATNEKAVAWARETGDKASHGTFADAAKFGEIVLNCTHGQASLEALRAAGADNLKGKVLIDVANPLDFSKGMPPALTHHGETSLAEQIQNAFPETRVVKAFNTITSRIMVEPTLLKGTHDLFICGNDAAAKKTVVGLATSLGWPRVADLGDLTRARGMEVYVLFWLANMFALGTPNFNIAVVR